MGGALSALLISLRTHDTIFNCFSIFDSFSLKGSCKNNAHDH